MKPEHDKTVEKNDYGAFLNRVLNSDEACDDYGVIHLVPQPLAVAYSRYTENDEDLLVEEEAKYLRIISEQGVEVLAKLSVYTGEQYGVREYLRGILLEGGRDMGCFALPLLAYVKSEYGPISRLHSW